MPLRKGAASASVCFACRLSLLPASSVNMVVGTKGTIVGEIQCKNIMV